MRRPDLTLAWKGLRDPMLLCTWSGVEEPEVAAANPALLDLVGLAEADVVGRPLSSLLLVGDAGRARIGRGGEAAPAGTGLAVLRRSTAGPLLVEWEVAPVYEGDGAAPASVSVFRETARPGPESGPPSATIPGTSLPGREEMVRRLERAVERAARMRAYAFAVLSLELDGLERAAARYGSGLAETAIATAAARVRGAVRSGDLVARGGPGRLLVLLDPFDAWGSPEHVLERLEARGAGGCRVAGLDLDVELAPLAACAWSHERPAGSAGDVLDEIERRHARDAGAGAPARPGGHHDRDLAELARAVRSGQLELAYLPLVSLESGRPVALEALLRWRHPLRGLLPAGAFLRDAERTGMMAHIGRWVLWRACHQVKAWESVLTSRPALPVHVNLSASELWEGDLLPALDRQVAEAGVKRSRVRLEVPERALARDLAGACRILEGLRERGFEIWLDRYGEGGVPLRDLPELPVRGIKIAPLPEWTPGASDGLPTHLRSVLRMAAELGWRTSASGIETEAQRELLLRAGCELGQGPALVDHVDGTGAGALIRHVV